MTTDKIVELEDATSVEVKIDVKTAADVAIRDGTDTLLDGSFTYNERLEPDFSYSVANTRGKLEINQPSHRNLDGNKLENKWDMRFGPAAPLDIEIDVSSGDTDVRVSTTSLASLDVDTSSGVLKANIGGFQDHLERVVAKSSSGDMSLDLDGIFPLLSLIELDESSGDIDLVLGGDFESLERLAIDCSSGNTVVDLTGSWSRDLDVAIDTSSGNVNIVAPSNVGAQIKVDVSSGNINANGFRIEGGSYVNDAYGTSAVTLRFSIDVSSGNVNLELGE